MTGGIWLGLAIAGYALSVAGFLVYSLRRNDTAGKTAVWVFLAGFVCHTAFLTVRSIIIGQLPVLNLGQALGFFGWTLAGGFFLLFWKFRLYILGALTSPLTLGLVLLGGFLPSGSGDIGTVFRSFWLTLHLITVFFGYAFFGLAFIAGLVYLLQESQIKSKRMGALFRCLPSLNVLDSINYTCLTFGFPLMSLGIITGMIYAQTTMGSYWIWDPKEVWSLVLWLFYAALLHQRLTVGWRGRRAAILSIVGFGVLCFTFVGVSLILPSYHSFESLELLKGK